MPRFGPEEISQIRRHRKDTTAFVIVRPENCFGLSPSDLSRFKGRRLVATAPPNLPEDPLPDSWVLVVPTCPEDDLLPVAEWATRRPRSDIYRIWFYELDSEDAAESYAVWADRGLPYPRRERVKDATEFSRVFANELNIRILLDHPVPSEQPS